MSAGLFRLEILGKCLSLGVTSQCRRYYIYASGGVMDCNDDWYGKINYLAASTV